MAKNSPDEGKTMMVIVWAVMSNEKKRILV